jgi:hypothetical protein
VRPDDAEAHWNEALLHLLTGDFRQGWPKHEWRWKRQSADTALRDLPQPLWDGTAPLQGKTILLYAEQGFGDTIQFCRYVPVVAALGARAILGVQKPLRTLMGSLAGGAHVFSPGEPMLACDLRCPLMSLPLAFGTTPETIPAGIPYLQPQADARAHWDAELQSRRPGARLRVGIAWSGNPGHVNDDNRSMAIETLLSLFDADATFVSLQADVRPGDAALLVRRDDVLGLGSALRDFSDTAALIACLDLVITVDTSVAHLAGALGKPVWVMLPAMPDWRWLLGRETSPWYPTARLFRQSHAGDWADVVLRVRGELQSLGG